MTNTATLPFGSLVQFQGGLNREELLYFMNNIYSHFLNLYHIVFFNIMLYFEP